MTLPTWRIGQTWWLGSSCLLCVGIDSHGSHQSEEIATYDAESGYSACPRCGVAILWDAPPEVHDLPWCSDCADLDARREDVDRARDRWESALHECRHDRSSEARERERELLDVLHATEDAYHEIRDAVVAREDALDECPATIRTDYPLTESGDTPADAVGGSTQEEMSCSQ